MSEVLFQIDGQQVEAGKSKDIRLQISETYLGEPVHVPLKVIRAKKPGPIVFVTAAIHGDEINGTGIIHDFMFGVPVHLLKGTLVLAPVVNVFGFEAHERYLPDRRDLNRCFPGSKTGSLASRVANKLITELADHCDYGIDLHTAAFQRTNFPNVRADLRNPEVKRLANAFGCALVIDGKGPVGSFRRECSKRSCPTIILEAGEPWKVEPGILQIGVQGIRNVLFHLGMLDGTYEKPPYQALIRKTTWIRATVGGILKFHVSPGQFVEEGQAVATNYSILGKEQNTLFSKTNGIVIGMTTMPAVKPGEPICHIGFLPPRLLKTYRKQLEKGPESPLQQVEQQLATSMDVIEEDG
jgi:predicted deacylase